MLSQSVAETIHAKVSGLVHEPLSVVDERGVVLASNDPIAGEQVDIEEARWKIDIHHDQDTAGYVVLSQSVPNFEEIAPLIRSIAELMLHQSLLLERLPQQEGRLDKFVYDLLAGSEDERTVMAEARLFDLDLTIPRIAIVIYLDDPVLTGEAPDPGDREVVEQASFDCIHGLIDGSVDGMGHAGRRGGGGGHDGHCFTQLISWPKYFRDPVVFHALARPKYGRRPWPRATRPPCSPRRQR